MGIRVALHHKTIYQYDRPVTLSPQVVRLRPAPHSRTPVHSYSLRVEPSNHFVNWQQDPQGNFLARLSFPSPTTVFSLEVDLVAEMTVVNPFDFSWSRRGERALRLRRSAARRAGAVFRVEPAGPRWRRGSRHPARGPAHRRLLVDLTAGFNPASLPDSDGALRAIGEVTLESASGSCRDSAWLLVDTLRHLGMAARFVSGYLIQLVPDQKPLDGPAGPPQDFTDLHAWAEVYLPGAGWVGLDPTSGLLAGEGHIPLAATPTRSRPPRSGLAAEPSSCITRCR